MDRAFMRNQGSARNRFVVDAGGPALTTLRSYGVEILTTRTALINKKP
jgi:hypothetical protein